MKHRQEFIRFPTERKKVKREEITKQQFYKKTECIFINNENISKGKWQIYTSSIKIYLSRKNFNGRLKMRYL